MIEIYDINNGKLKYSAYTFWQLCEMVTDDLAYHTGDEDNDILSWIEKKARALCKGTRKKEVLKRLEELLEFGQTEGDRAFASRISLLLGEIALRGGEHESAIEHSQKAAHLQPDRVEALHQMARGFFALRQYREAADAWRKANGILPSEEACLALAMTLEKLKLVKDQEKTLRSLVRNYPRSIKGLDTLARLYRRRGRSNDAARLAQRIVDLRPERGKRSHPLFGELLEALIWAKYNYEARKLDKVLEFLDEEQERNPREWLSLLKAVMLYKLDKRLCREELCYELGKYFEGVGYERDILTEDLNQVTEVFGRDFCRGVVRFINNQFATRLPRTENSHFPPRLAASPPAT